jgi:hypothetical protein
MGGRPETAEQLVRRQRGQHQDGEHDLGNGARPHSLDAECQAQPQRRAGRGRVAQRARAAAEHGKLARAVQQVGCRGGELAAQRREPAFGLVADDAGQQRGGQRGGRQ